MSNNNHTLYLYRDEIELVITTTEMYVDNRPMNIRTLQAHKTITNEIFFKIRDRDRKPQNVFSETLRAHIVAPHENQRLVSRILDHTSEVGLVKLILTEGDLANINPGRYHVFVTRGDEEIMDRPVYTDQNNNIKFDIEITDQVALTPVPTQVNTTFMQTGNTLIGDAANTFVSSALYGNINRNFMNAQHTMVIYPDTYTGQVVVQASCLTGAPDSDDTSVDWFVVETHDLVDKDSAFDTTFSVNCNWIRIVHYPDDGNSSISQVQLRN